MTMRWTIRGALAALLTASVLLAGGCGSGNEPKKDGDKPVAVASGGKKDGKGETKHGGWWCTEHGIPEDECSMCSAKVEKACKAKGDWCDQHNRALSQCFICNPK